VTTRSVRLRDSSGRQLGRTIGGGLTYDGHELTIAVPVPREWGPWRLDTRTWVLYPIRPYRYEVDLEECLTSAQVLDRIMQVAQKSWADDATIAGLARALADVLRPQGNLCPFGSSKRISRAKARELARDAQDERDEGYRVYPELASGAGHLATIAEGTRP
jgi:hypothetical protein